MLYQRNSLVCSDKQVGGDELLLPVCDTMGNTMRCS